MNKKIVLGSVILFSSVLVLASCGHTTKEEGEIVKDKTSETVYSNNSGDEVVVGNTDLKDEGYFKDIVRSGSHSKIKEIANYDPDFEDDNWDKISLKIDHAKIVNVTQYKDEDDTEYKELISLKYKIKNEDTTDKNITPDKAVLVLKDGKEVDAEVFLDYWDDEVLTSNKHKDGYIHFKVKDENKLSEIKSIKLTFKAKDKDGKKITHTYDVSLPIE